MSPGTARRPSRRSRPSSRDQTRLARVGPADPCDPRQLAGRHRPLGCRSSATRSSTAPTAAPGWTIVDRCDHPQCHLHARLRREPVIDSGSERGTRDGYWSTWAINPTAYRISSVGDRSTSLVYRGTWRTDNELGRDRQDALRRHGPWRHCARIGSPAGSGHRRPDVTDPRQGEHLRRWRLPHDGRPRVQHDAEPAGRLRHQLPGYGHAHDPAARPRNDGTPDGLARCGRHPPLTAMSPAPSLRECAIVTVPTPRAGSPGGARGTTRGRHRGTSDVEGGHPVRAGHHPDQALSRDRVQGHQLQHAPQGRTCRASR